MPLRLVLVLAMFAAFAPVAAEAHTHFRGSMPAAGQELASPPALVMMHFSADAQIGEVRVLDARGADRVAGAPFHPPGEPNVVEAHLPVLPRGQYGVIWRVIADDGHVSSGTFAFGVGMPAGAPPVAAGVAESPDAAVLIAVLRFLLLGGLIAGAGLALGSLLTVPAPRAATLSMLEFGAWIVLAFVAFADLLVQAAVTGGTFDTVMHSRYGVLHAVIGLAALLAVLAVSGGRRRWPVLAVAIAVAIVSEALSGHGATGAVPVVGTIFDAAHLLAAIVWIGALLTVLFAPDIVDARRTSNVAMWSVALLVISSIVQVLRNVAPLRGMITTVYGLEICAKIVLLLITLAVAWQSRRRVTGGTAAVIPSVRLEMVLLTVVIAVTAVLVDGQPPR